MDREIRFGITDNSGHRSATWKLWTWKDKSDVYLTTRQLGGILKASLHDPGNWQFGFTKEAWDNKYGSEFETDKSRHFEIWQRPRPFIDGITLAFRIITPYSAIKTPIENNSDKIIWILNCSEGKATEIDIVITSTSQGKDSWPGKNGTATKLIGNYETCKGEFVWAVYWEVPLPDLSSITEKPFNFFQGKSTADLRSDNLRLLVFGDSQDGVRALIDCVVEK